MRRSKKFVSALTACVTAAAILLASAVPCFAAPSDIKGHWAEAEIQMLFDLGVFEGLFDANGKFEPDKAMTRAEYFAVINVAFDFKQEKDISFKDVPSDSWYAPEIRKAVAAGYVKGYGDGTVRPESSISRAEAMVILYKLLELKPGSAKIADAAKIPAWANDAVNACVAAGLLKTDAKGNIRPGGEITRAETLVSLLGTLDM